MKKMLIILSAIAFFGVNTVNAQAVAAKAKVENKKSKKSKAVTAVKVDGAGMVFEKETIDYGTIQQNAEGKREFVLTNNGTEPLIITNAAGSCGCTVPTTPKDPIAPGAKAVIGVKYDTNRPGPFTKNVTVSSNAKGMPSKVLTITGTVIAAPAAPAVPTAATPAPAVKS